jgi:hypothetical protein
VVNLGTSTPRIGICEQQQQPLKNNPQNEHSFVHLCAPLLTMMLQWLPDETKAIRPEQSSLLSVCGRPAIACLECLLGQVHKLVFRDGISLLDIVGTVVLWGILEVLCYGIGITRCVDFVRSCAQTWIRVTVSVCHSLWLSCSIACWQLLLLPKASN